MHRSQGGGIVLNRSFAQLSGSWKLRCVLLGFTLATACLKIEVESELLPPVPAIPDPGPQAAEVHLRFGGERMEDRSWAKALTISRFFFSSVENQSGSPRELLEPAVREVLRQRGYRSAPGRLAAADEGESQSARPSPAVPAGELFLDVFAVRNQLLWLPPREFIQTPKARARGTVRVDVKLRSRLLRSTGPGSPPVKVWSGEFNEAEDLRVLPGEEGDGLATGAALAFRNYLRRLQLDLPAAASLATAPAK